jgi:hypothetical protein
MKKTIILVSVVGESYQELVRAVRQTWGFSTMEALQILYYYGYRQDHELAPDQCIQFDDELICGVDSKDMHLRNKIAFNYIYNNYNFEYIFRCNVSNYIVQQKMADFLKDKPINKFYCGSIDWYQGISYANGAGFFLSKDLVKLLVDNSYSSIDRSLPEDVALGKFFREKDITVIDAPRQYFYKGSINYLDVNQYHYYFGGHVSDKISAMYEVQQILAER